MTLKTIVNPKQTMNWVCTRKNIFSQMNRKQLYFLLLCCSHTFPKLPFPMTFKKSKSVGLALK